MAAAGVKKRRSADVNKKNKKLKKMVDWPRGNMHILSLSIKNARQLAAFRVSPR